MSEVLALELRMESLTVCVKYAIPIGLILTELITNAIEHAFPAGKGGTLMLTLHRTSSGARLELVDDGIGLPVGFNPVGTAGLGLYLVRVLSAQIEGGFRIEGESTGTRCILEFPLHGDCEE
jgi:two-component sensor histidine kinase